MWKHRLSNINEDLRIGYCAECGETMINRKGYTLGGNIKWRCVRSGASNKKAARIEYRKSLKLKCERCGFIPEHICQLDIHHKDGDHNNNDPSNHKTLCANCHRLHLVEQDCSCSTRCV